MEDIFLKELGLEAFDVTTQVYPRSQDFRLLSILNEIAIIASKFALDLRILQSSGFAELQEGFSKNQVGSSAMPFKRNPINSEKICSLARLMKGYLMAVWDDAANSILERTLDDSANRRIAIAESFLCLDEILLTFNKILTKLNIDKSAVKGNLSKFSEFSGTEVLLMEGVKRGADRQILHEEIRECSLLAWENVRRGQPANLSNILVENTYILKYLSKKNIINYVMRGSSIDFSKERALLIKKKIDNRFS